MDSLTILSLGGNDMLILWLDQMLPVIHVYRVNRHPFSITFINSVNIECQGVARSLSNAKFSETNILVLIQSNKTVEYVWVKLGNISDDKSWKLTTLIEKKDFNCQDYLINYQERDKVLAIFDGFCAIMTEKIDHSQPIILNSKKVDFATDIGTLNNLADLAWESVISVSYSSSVKTLVILSKSHISHLPFLYWIQWDVSQLKGKVLWRRSLFKKLAQAFFLEQMPDKASSHTLSESEDVILVHNQGSISIMNSQGLLREFPSLELGEIVSMVIWEYKNNIITVLTVNEASEYFMVQIEPSFQYNLQIIQKYNLFPLVPHALPFYPQRIIVFSTLPSQNQSPAIFFTFNQDYGWQLLANEPAVGEYSFVYLSTTAQLLPTIVNVKEVGSDEEDQSRIAVREFDERTQIIKFKYGPKLFPNRFCLVDIFDQFLPDIQISLVESIDISKNKRKDQADKKSAIVYYFRLFSDSFNVSSILQVSWTSDEGFYSIQNFELNQNQRVKDIFQIKSSNYFLCVDAVKITLISASISNSSSLCEVVYEISLPEIIQALLLQGCDDYALSQALTEMTGDILRIDSSQSLNDESILLNCSSLLFSITLNLSQILNKSSVIRRVSGRYLPTKRINSTAVYFQDDFCLQIYHFDNGEFEIQWSRSTLNPARGHLSTTLPKKRILNHSKATAMQVVPLNNDLSEFGLLMCFDDHNCYWVKLSMNKQENRTIETSILHQFYLSGKGVINKIIPSDDGDGLVNKLPCKKFLICFSEPQENWKSITFHHFPFSSYEIDEICVANVMRSRTERSSIVPCNVWNSHPTYLPRINGFLWLESTIFGSTDSSAEHTSYHLVQSSTSEIKKNYWIMGSLLITGKVISMRKVEKNGMIIAIIYEEENEIFELILLEESSFKIIQKLVLTEDIHQLFASDLMDLIESMEISLYPNSPIFDIDHTIEGTGEGYSFAVPIYFHLTFITPDIFDGGEENCDLLHLLTFVFHEVNSSPQITLLNYLYLPFVRRQLKAEKASLLAQKFNFRNRSQNIADCFIQTSISNFDLLLIFSSGQVKIISWIGQRQIVETLIKSENSRRNVPTMIGAYAMKTDNGPSTSLQRKVTTSMTLKVIAEFSLNPTNLQRGFEKIVTISLDEKLIILALENKSVMHVYSIEPSGGTSDLPLYTQEDLGLVDLTIDVRSDQMFYFSLPRRENEMTVYDEYFKNDLQVFLIFIPSQDEMKLRNFETKDGIDPKASLMVRIASLNISVLNRDYLKRVVANNIFKNQREGKLTYNQKPCRISLSRINCYPFSTRHNQSIGGDSKVVYEFIRQEIIAYFHRLNPSIHGDLNSSYEEMKEKEFSGLINYLSREDQSTIT